MHLHSVGMAVSHIVFNKEMSSKIAMDHAEAIVVIAMWPTQPHYSKAMGMLVQQLILLPKTLDLLRLPFSPNINILFCQNFSCWHASYQEFTWKVSRHYPLFLAHWDSYTIYNTHQQVAQVLTSTSGSSTVVRNKFIHFTHL